MRLALITIVAAALGWFAGPFVGERLMERVLVRANQGDGWLVNYQLGDFEGRWFVRSVVARNALGALVAEEALYYRIGVDAQGRGLTGERTYVMHFPSGETPPVGAFWSITPYDTATLSLTTNPVGRYQFGDRTEGLQYGEDGSLTIYLAREEPPTGAANWLPIPDGEFDLLLRAYEPSPQMLSGAWMPPIPMEGGGS